MKRHTIYMTQKSNTHWLYSCHMTCQGTDVDCMWMLADTRGGEYTTSSYVCSKHTVSILKLKTINHVHYIMQ